MIDIRRAQPPDFYQIKRLYNDVASQEGGLVRECKEITVEYIEGFMSHSRESGIELVAVDNSSGNIVGELHAHQLGFKVFNHVLGNLTIVIAPLFQGKGIGRSLFNEFFALIEKEKPEIVRVELIVRETNKRAIGLYESLGFQIEGRMESRIRGVAGKLEADIPMAWVRPMINQEDRLREKEETLMM